MLPRVHVNLLLCCYNFFLNLGKRRVCVCLTVTHAVWLEISFRRILNEMHIIVSTQAPMFGALRCERAVLLSSDNSTMGGYDFRKKKKTSQLDEAVFYSRTYEPVKTDVRLNLLDTGSVQSTDGFPTCLPQSQFSFPPSAATPLLSLCPLMHLDHCWGLCMLKWFSYIIRNHGGDKALTFPVFILI